MTAKLVKPNEMTWEPHPTLSGVEVAHLLQNDPNSADITCALVHLTVGAKPERHLHEDADDILYVIQGKAKMWIDRVGDVPLELGTFLKVPKGVLHQPHDIEEDFIAYDVWSRNNN